MLELLVDGVQVSFGWIMGHLLIINALLSIVIIFFQREKPTTVWAWLLVLYCLPVVGFFLYLVLGQSYRKEKMFRAKEIEGEMTFAARKQGESIYNKKLRLKDPEQEQFRQLVLYNLKDGEAVLTDNNDIKIYTHGKDKFKDLIYEMDHARHYIHLQYYIIKKDEVWKEIEEVLIRKVKQGVEVRVLFDSMGCRGMKNSDWERLEAYGIQVAEFFPGLFGNLQFRANFRNHRKIAVIDGRIGFIGGFNIGKEYIGKDKKFGHWRDTHICIEGSAVTFLGIRFVMDWNYAAQENLFLQDDLFMIPKYERAGREPVQIISSGPDSHSQTIRNNYLKLIHMAKKNVYIQTPYFIPDEDILEALKIAALSGVDVRIMIPCKPDHPFVYWASYAYLGDVIKAGAKCYTYNDGFLHSKCMCVDGLVTCMGTANMDIRSFALNFEVNATIYSAKTTSKLEMAFHEDLKKSTQITKKKYMNRSLFVKGREQISRLLSPLL